MNGWNVTTRSRHAPIVLALIVPLAGAVFGMRAHATETERFSREVVVGNHTIGIMLESGPESHVAHGILDGIAFVDDGAVPLSDDVISLAVVGSSTARSDDGEERLSWSEAAPLLARVLANHDNLYSVMPVREMDVIQAGDYSFLVPPALTTSTRLASAGLLDKLAKRRSVRRKLYAAAALRAVALEEARRYDETLEGDLASWRSSAVTMLGVTDFAAATGLDVYTELRIISGMQKAKQHGASTVGIAAKVRKRVAASNLGKSVRALAVLAFAVDLAEGISESRLRQRLLAAAADAVLVSSLEDARRLLEAEDADPAMIEGLSDAIGQLTTMSQTRLEQYAETGADALAGSLPSLAALVATYYLGTGGAALVVREAAELGEELLGHAREVLTVSAMATLGKTLRPRIEALIWRNAIGTTRAEAYSVRELVSLHDRLGAEATASVYNVLWTDRWKDPSSLAGIARGAGLSLAEWFTADAGTEEAFKDEVAWRIGRVRKNAALSAALPQVLVKLQARFVGPPAVVAKTPPVDCAGWDSDDGELMERFYRAITAETALACLKAGADLDATFLKGLTPLHAVAAMSDDPAAIAALVGAGADPNAKNGIGTTPLHAAGAFNENPAIVAALAAAGADPNAPDAFLRTALHYAAGYNENPDVVLALLDAGARPNPELTIRAATALHYAARGTGNPAVIAALLKGGADPNARDEDGRTPLEVAKSNGRPAEIIAALNEAASAGVGPEGSAAPDTAAAPSVDCRGWNSNDRESIQRFYEDISPSEVVACLGVGADPNAHGWSGVSPLHMAASVNENPEVIAALLKGGADPESRDVDEETPLHYAAGDNESLPVLEALLDAGADPNAQGIYGRRPLHRAAGTNENLAVTVALLEAGADPQAPEFNGSTPLHLATVNENAAVINTLLDAGANPNARDRDGHSPLHVAAGFGGSLAAVTILLAAGSDPAAEGEDGRTPLDVARFADISADTIALLEQAAPTVAAARAGDGAFSGERPIAEGAKGAYAVFATDLDGDGDADVLSASQIDNEIAWYENLGDGALFDQRIISRNADGAASVFAADLDGDGDADVLSASSYDDKIAWYENLGDDTFSGEHVISRRADGAEATFAADLDGDGDVDVLSASSFDDKVAWYENLGGGRFSAQRVITADARRAVSVSAADLDGDTDADVLFASWKDGKIAWYENLGGGVFVRQPVITRDADRPRSVVPVDLDGDSDIDVLFASLDGKVGWFENLGGGRFSVQRIITRDADSPYSVSAADLDSDGDADVLTASHGDDEIAWYENVGGGAYSDKRVIAGYAFGANSVVAVDLDGDGDADVLSAHRFGHKIAWYENQSSGTK